MELFKQFQDNPSFKKWLSDTVFRLTYNKEGKPYEMPWREHRTAGYDSVLQQDAPMAAEESAVYETKKDVNRTNNINKF